MTPPHSRLCIFALAAATFLLAPAVSFAATLDISPASISVAAGEMFTEVVRVSSTDQALNATAGTINFPTDLLSAVSVSNANSILTLWVQQPTFSNAHGTVKWSGVVPNPGFTGGSGRVLSVRFIAQKTGTANLRFTSSEVLANDGSGTNILTAANPATVFISQPPPQSLNPELAVQISSPTHPDQTKWYNLSRAILDWTSVSSVTATRLGYDQDAGGIPTVFYTGLTPHKELQLNDGIWYFHVQEKDSSGWGPISTFRIQIDTVPPLPITLKFPNGTTTPTTSIAVQFGTTDALSGINHYLLSVDGNTTAVSAQDGSNVYSLSVNTPGVHTLTVTAFDEAGNSVSAQGQFATRGTNAAPSTPGSFVWLIANYLSLVLIAIAAFAAVLFIGWYLWHHFRIFRRKLRGELDPSHQLLRQQFTEINESIMQEILSLEKVRARGLTPEEEHVIANLRKVLEKSEGIIGKEMDKMVNQKQKEEQQL
ncbi:MAG: hypothetical protein KGJ31_01180 [Patescibacteria group bacterium]|nr:hypothetical protein [Patescibacteria group bacterium]